MNVTLEIACGNLVPSIFPNLEGSFTKINESREVNNIDKNCPLLPLLAENKV
jgi:hypothetical protein